MPNRKPPEPNDPYHAHVYYDRDSWDVARRLHQGLCDMQLSGTLPGLVLVGKMYEEGVGPHPKAQFEVQFYASAVPAMDRILRASGLTALVHPLTDDDLADHTTLADWIGEPLPLDESVLDPPGHNQGIARFGKVDY
jgi:aromatic ring-cleaving dioxygenase